MKTMSFTGLILKAAQSFFTVWALMKAGRMEPGNILTGILFLFSLLFFCYADNKLTLCESVQKRRISRTSLIVAIIFSILYMAVDYPFYIETLTSSLFRVSILLFVFLGFTALFYHVLACLYTLAIGSFLTERILFTGTDLSVWSSHPETDFSHRKTIFHKIAFRLFSLYKKRTGLCTFFLCLLCWIPYFLYQYPGIMTPDSLNQFEQVLDVIPYSNHHPWVHTLLIKLIYTIGFQITGSMLVSLSLYTLFQMCLLSGSICYFINTLKIYRTRPAVCFLITLFYALVPYHAVYSVTIWKDIPFAAFVLLFCCALLRLINRETVPALPFKNICVLAVSGLAMCLFRSNGWYAFLLCLPFLLIYFRKKARTMYPVFLGIFAAAVIIKYPVMNAFHVTQPDLVESLSIPIQQVTAVICNDRALTEEELELIEQVVDLTYIKKLYDFHYADNIKELVRAGNQDYLKEHKKEFLKLWVGLGLRYPGDYLTAYIHQTYGYWYPDSFYPVADAEGVSATSLGVSHTPLIRGPLVVKAKEIAVKLGGMLPLYGIIWSMGAICWVLIFSIGAAFIRQEKQKLILYLPSLSLLFTVLIATPVATEFRYVYFMVLSLPFYLMTALLPLTCPSPAAGSFSRG